MENMGYNDNLTTCKYCGNMIARKSKICPHCGGKNKNTKWGIIFPLLIVAIVVIIVAVVTFCSWFMNDDEYYGSYEKETMTEEEYKETCYSVSYEELARNPGKYDGELLTFTGEVFQKSYDSDGYAEYLIAVTREDTGGEYYSYTYYTDNIYAYYYYGENDKLLEDDIVTIYGKADDEYTYESVSGAEITVPAFEIEYVEFQ